MQKASNKQQSKTFTEFKYKQIKKININNGKDQVHNRGEQEDRAERGFVIPLCYFQNFALILPSKQNDILLRPRAFYVC